MGTASPPQVGGAPSAPDEPEEPDQPDPPDTECSEEGRELIDLVNDLRAEHDLPAIPESPSLCFVAETHVVDLIENQPYAEGDDCALQSWSDVLPGVDCCYASDASNPECMWDKPRQLTEYEGNGYESVAINPMSPVEAMAHFQGIDAHLDLMLEQGAWDHVDWQAVGAEFRDGHTTIWFGEQPDATPE